MASTTRPHYDIIRKHLKRSLPVPLTRDEQTDIAIAAAKKRRQLKELEEDLDAEKKRRKQQIDELQREVDVHDRELDTGEQERIVMCMEVFRDGMVYTVRTDSWEEFEPRPANAQEAQRFLPAVESTLQDSGPRPLLDQALAAQAAEDSAEDAANDAAAAAAGDGDGVPAELTGDDQEDDGLSEPQAVAESDDDGHQHEVDAGDGEPYEADGDAPDGGDEPDEDETPAQRSVREAEEGRAERAAGRGGKRGAGKRGGKGGAK